MRCPDPECRGESRVTHTRHPDGKEYVRRRRECEKCGERFTTYEQYARSARPETPDGDSE